MGKEIRELVRELEAQGFAVRRTSKGHYFITKAGQPITTISGTPSDHKALANAIAKLKRAGFQPK